MPDRTEQTPTSIDSGLSVLELFAILWGGRKQIVLCTVAATVLAITLALVLPPVYRSTALVAPIESDSDTSSVQSLLNPLSGIQGLYAGAGFSSSIEKAIAVLNSRLFALQFINKNNLLPELFAERWDEGQQIWIDASGIAADAPEQWQIFEKFESMLSVERSRETGLIQVSIDWEDPVKAAQWVNQIIEDVNLQLRNNDIDQAQKSLDYLSGQLEETSVVEMRQALFSLIEAQTQTIMLANVREEYVFDVIDPAVVPEFRIAPARRLIAISGLAIGLFLGCALVYASYTYRHFKSQR